MNQDIHHGPRSEILFWVKKFTPLRLKIKLRSEMLNKVVRIYSGVVYSISKFLEVNRITPLFWRQ